LEIEPSGDLPADGGDNFRGIVPRRLYVTRNGNQTQARTWTANDKQKSGMTHGGRLYLGGNSWEANHVCD
jgi:hypothetical protein